MSHKNTQNIATLIGVGLLSILFLFNSECRANDSVAAFGVGGLVFEKTDSVRMKSEVLRISVDKIDVSYVFQNTSKKDIVTEVAFPLPDLDVADYGHTDSFPHIEDPGFEIWVDDKRVVPQVEVRSFLRDGTELPPINESRSGVNPDRFWTSFMEERNGEKAVYGGADHRAFATG